MLGVLCIFLLVCCVVLMTILWLHEKRLKGLEAECDDLRSRSDTLAELSLKHIRNHE